MGELCLIDMIYPVPYLPYLGVRVAMARAALSVSGGRMYLRGLRYLPDID